MRVRRISTLKKMGKLQDFALFMILGASGLRVSAPLREIHTIPIIPMGW